MSRPTECAGSFVYRKMPHWRDFDHARIVYTANFPQFGMEAVDAWFAQCAGADFLTMNSVWKIGTPFVHLECDFRSPVRPGDVLLIEVLVDRVGTSSLHFKLTGRCESDGRTCFDARFSCVCVDAGSEALLTIPLDPRLRRAAEACLAAQDEKQMGLTAS